MMAADVRPADHRARIAAGVTQAEASAAPAENGSSLCRRHGVVSVDGASDWEQSCEPRTPSNLLPGWSVHRAARAATGGWAIRARTARPDARAAIYQRVERGRSFSEQSVERCRDGVHGFAGDLPDARAALFNGRGFFRSVSRDHFLSA